MIRRFDKGCATIEAAKVIHNLVTTFFSVHSGIATTSVLPQSINTIPVAQPKHCPIQQAITNPVPLTIKFLEKAFETLTTLCCLWNRVDWTMRSLYFICVCFLKVEVCRVEIGI